MVDSKKVATSGKKYFHFSIKKFPKFPDSSHEQKLLCCRFKATSCRLKETASKSFEKTLSLKRSVRPTVWLRCALSKITRNHLEVLYATSALVSGICKFRKLFDHEISYELCGSETKKDDLTLQKVADPKRFMPDFDVEFAYISHWRKNSQNVSATRRTRCFINTALTLGFDHKRNTQDSSINFWSEECHQTGRPVGDKFPKNLRSFGEDFYPACEVFALFWVHSFSRADGSLTDTWNGRLQYKLSVVTSQSWSTTHPSKYTSFCIFELFFRNISSLQKFPVHVSIRQAYLETVIENVGQDKKN